MSRIRRVGVISVANVTAAVAFVITLFFVILFALVALPMRGNLSQLGFPSAGGGLAVLFIAPFIYAAFGWITGAISALVYNLVASFTGGIQLDLETRTAPAAWTSGGPGGPMPPAPPAPPATPPSVEG